MAAKNVLQESALVALVGAALAFACNAVSPRGLALTRNYFPGVIPGSLPAAKNAQPSPGAPAASADSPSSAQLLEARLKSNGLRLIASNQVVQLFQDVRFTQGLVVFVDA